MPNGKAAFAEQAQGLIEGGVDVLWIETMSDLNEVKAAIEGARSVSADIPICATMSYDTRGRTMMGVTGALMAQELAGLGLTAIGANCGNNLPETESRAGRDARRGAGADPDRQGQRRDAPLRGRQAGLRRLTRGDGRLCRPCAPHRRAA